MRAWGNRPRIHTLPVPQKSSELVYSPASVDLSSRQSKWVQLLSIVWAWGKPVARKRHARWMAKQLNAPSYSHRSGTTCPQRLRSTSPRNTPSGWLGSLIPHNLPPLDITSRKQPWFKVLSFRVTLRKDRQDPDKVDMKNRNLSLKNIWSKPGVVDHACNPSYTGGRDGEDRVC
jgi:hypothetical protein